MQLPGDCGMMRAIKLALAAVAIALAAIGQARAGVLTLDYTIEDLSGGEFRYNFDLILTNQDNSWSPGQNFNWIVFGDALPGPSPLADFAVTSETFLDPNLFFSFSSGGHNGPTWIDVKNLSTGGWIPSGVSDSVTWSGFSSHDITSGLLFSNLQGTGAHADFDTAHFLPSATAAPEPSSLVLFGIGTSFMGLAAARRRRREKSQA